jgi:stage III sporulation protein AB
LSGNEQVLSGGETGAVQVKWSEGIKKCRGISRDDKAALQALGEHLGTSGKDAQIATLRLCRHRLNTLLESAKQELQANGKMLKGLGFFGGILITITLI